MTSPQVLSTYNETLLRQQSPKLDLSQYMGGAMQELYSEGIATYYELKNRPSLFEYLFELSTNISDPLIPDQVLSDLSLIDQPRTTRSGQLDVLAKLEQLGMVMDIDIVHSSTGYCITRKAFMTRCMATSLRHEYYCTLEAVTQGYISYQKKWEDEASDDESSDDEKSDDDPDCPCYINRRLSCQLNRLDDRTVLTHMIVSSMGAQTNARMQVIKADLSALISDLKSTIWWAIYALLVCWAASAIKIDMV